MLVVGVVVAGCGGSSVTAPKKRPATTTTTVAVPIAPLTGLPDPGGSSLGRSAVAVKIENSPVARPQSGLDVADVVYEEVVEGGITRFWAVFHSQVKPELVGPIRSVRMMDPNIVSALGGVAAFSGGTPANVALINATPVVTISENNANNGASQPRCEGNTTATFCRSTRAAPSNLYGRLAMLFERGGQPVPPVPLFTYVDTEGGQAFTGAPVSQFKVNFRSGYDVTYQWDPALGWKRVQGVQPFLGDDGQQIAVTNVVVQFTPYSGDSNGQLIGTGDAWIFSNGQQIIGRWSKADPTEPTQFTDAFGTPIALTPGRTWVELLPTGQSVDVTPGTPPTTVAPVPSTTAPRR